MLPGTIERGLAAMDDASLLARCKTLATQLESNPVDHRVELEFRHAADAYAAFLQQRSSQDGGLAAEALLLDASADPTDVAQCTVDLDLRFLGKAALGVQADRLHANVDPATAAAGERAALMQAIMLARTANTGYMASAPPTQALEHFFDLTKRSGGIVTGRLTRRMLWIDYAQRELTLIFKEEESKAFAFASLAAVEPIEGGVRLSLSQASARGHGSSETLTFYSPSEAECERLRARLEHVLSLRVPAEGARAAGMPPPPPPTPPPSGRVRSWLMSGTVEKEGKLRWASRWLVLTRDRLYVLRNVVSLCPLNVIPLGKDVMVAQGALEKTRVFTLVTAARSFSFRTSDEKLTERWVLTITERCEATIAAATSGARAHGKGSAKGSAKAADATAVADAAVDDEEQLYETDEEVDDDENLGSPGGASLKPKEVGARAAALVASLATQLGTPPDQREVGVEQLLELSDQMRGVASTLTMPRSMRPAAASDGAVPAGRLSSAGMGASAWPQTPRGGHSKTTGLTNRVRKLVSLEKRRFVGDGFDLDLTYITPRVIAMGFPSEGAEGVYRNPMSEVVTFLETRHREHYMVYNLCSERSYEATKFNKRVQVFPFDDHNPPPLRMMGEFCQSVKEFLTSHPSNVVAIHCKAGKGRTGVMIAAFLLHDRFFAEADDALAFYGFSRTNDCEGVTIPSQRTYVHYFAALCKQPELQERLAGKGPVFQLERVRLLMLPNALGEKGKSALSLHVRSRALERSWSSKRVDVSEARVDDLDVSESELDGPPPPHRSSYSQLLPFAITNSKGEVVGKKVTVPVADFAELCTLPIHGDIRIEVQQNSEALFHFWFHTAMLTEGRERLIRCKWHLDGIKDAKHKKYDAHFRVELQFAPSRSPSVLQAGEL